MEGGALSLRDLYETDDPGFVMYAKACLFEAVRLKREAQDKAG